MPVRLLSHHYHYQNHFSGSTHGSASLTTIKSFNDSFRDFSTCTDITISFRSRIIWNIFSEWCGFPVTNFKSFNFLLHIQSALVCPNKIIQRKILLILFPQARIAKVNFWHVSIDWSSARCKRNLWQFFMIFWRC